MISLLLDITLNLTFAESSGGIYSCLICSIASTIAAVTVNSNDAIKLSLFAYLNSLSMRQFGVKFMFVIHYRTDWCIDSSQ